MVKLLILITLWRGNKLYLLVGKLQINKDKFSFPFVVKATSLKKPLTTMKSLAQIDYTNIVVKFTY